MLGLFEVCDWPGSPPPQTVDGMIGSDLQEPIHEWSVRIVAAEILVGLQEGLLGSILGLVSIPQQPEAPVEARALVSSDQVGECTIVTLPYPFNPHGFGGPLHDLHLFLPPAACCSTKLYELSGEKLRPPGSAARRLRPGRMSFHS